jgi:cytochrome P450
MPMSAAEPPAGARVVDYFDHNTREYVDERHRWYQEIRRDVGPVFWSPNYGGYWVVIGFAELEEAARDWETFSSKHIVDQAGRACPYKDGLLYEGLFVPPRGFSSLMLEEDPPAWERSREALAATFSMPAAQRWRPRLQDLVDACLDRRIESGRIDFAKDVSNIVPAILSLELAGLTTDDYEMVARNHHLTSHIPGDDPRWGELAGDLARERQQVVDAVQARKTGARGRDVISVLLNARDRGADFSDADIVKLASLIIGAGIDTTASVLNTAFILLTRQPELRRRLMEEPRLTVDAFDEFLRISTPTQGLCRTVTRNVELGGQTIRRGDRVMLCFAAACRDPAAFERPDEVVLDRKPNLHVAFGSGTHRCLGQFYAKLEFDIIFSTVLRRAPDFQVDLDAVRSFDNVGVVTGFTSVPATFTPGAKLGVDPKVPGFFAAA